MQVKRVGRGTKKLLQAMLGKAPEALNAVDVMRAARKLILAVIQAITLRVVNAGKSIIAARAARVTVSGLARPALPGSLVRYRVVSDLIITADSGYL